jgi:hypothetical protein
MIKDVILSLPQLPSSIAQAPLSNLTIDPDKDLYIELLNFYKYLKPNELLRESEAEES